MVASTPWRGTASLFPEKFDVGAAPGESGVARRAGERALRGRAASASTSRNWPQDSSEDDAGRWRFWPRRLRFRSAMAAATAGDGSSAGASAAVAGAAPSTHAAASPASAAPAGAGESVT